jgi:ankyrin repeat protein
MSGGNWKGMFKAVQDGDLGLVEYYLRAGIDPNYQHPEFMASAVVESIRFNHMDILAELLKNGADPKIKEIFGGDTPLSVAKEKNNQKAIDLINSYLQKMQSE